MYEVHIENKGDTKFFVNAKGYEFVVDTAGSGVTPPDALLASLGSCIGVYIRKYAESAHLPVPAFAISVSAEFAPEKPVCFRTIKVAIDLKGNTLEERRKHALLEFIKNCPVHNTLHVQPQVEIEVV